jgi:hypothetical protein
MSLVKQKDGDVRKSIEKTIKYIVYMKASSFVLTRLLNTVLKSKVIGGQ